MLYVWPETVNGPDDDGTAPNSPSDPQVSASRRFISLDIPGARSPLLSH